MALSYLGGFMSTQGANVYPYKIENSALIESGFSASPALGTNARISFWFKPTLATVARMADMTGHFHVDITKANTTVTVKINGGAGINYTGTIGTYFHNLIENVLTTYAGSPKGYYSELYGIDGENITATFGRNSPVVSGLWTPKNPGSLMYGTEGSYLDFSNAAALGIDASGNGNNWTVNGSPVQTLDTPTNNYCTWNALEPTTRMVWSNGNLTVSMATGGDISRSTMGSSHPYYFEVEIGSLPSNICGVGAASSYGAEVSDLGYVRYNSNGSIVVDGSVVATIGSYTTGDVIGCVVEPGVSISWYKNNVFARTESVGAGTWFPLVNATGPGPVVTLITGSTGFTYTPPEGFLPLCAANLPDPTILRSSTVADVVLREGTGGTTSVTSLEFQPDWVNIKDRDNVRDWALFDSERGATKYLSTNDTDAEATDANSLTAFGSTGYTLGTSSLVNHSGASFLDLCLKAGVEQGFYQEAGIVHTTGTPTVVTHGLGKAVTFALVKRTDAAGDWTIYHTALGDGKYFRFTTAAAVTSAGYWPTNTSTQFAIPGALATGTYVVYLFTDSDIFKAFSYTGNGLADGPFVNLGGRPLSIPFAKNAVNVDNWREFNSVREPSNPIGTYLRSNNSGAEITDSPTLYNTSTGFKVKGGATGNSLNKKTELHIGLAILQSAAKYANAF